VDIQASDDVGVCELGQKSDLALEQSACDFALEVADSDLLDGDYCVGEGVAAAVDLAEAALAHLVAQVEHVVLDFLHRLPLLDLVDFHLRGSLSINFNNQILYQTCVATLPFESSRLLFPPLPLSSPPVLSPYSQRSRSFSWKTSWI
jgi:hypothetical protein